MREPNAQTSHTTQASW